MQTIKQILYKGTERENMKFLPSLSQKCQEIMVEL